MRGGMRGGLIGCRHVASLCATSSTVAIHFPAQASKLYRPCQPHSPARKPRRRRRSAPSRHRGRLPPPR
jgi:hypothetical protein